VVEKSADFTACFSKTLLLEDDCYSLSAKILLSLIDVQRLRTFGSKAGICGVGIFRSRFSNLQLLLLEVLFPLVLVLVGLCHLVKLAVCFLIRFQMVLLRDIKRQCRSSRLQSSKPWQ